VKVLLVVSRYKAHTSVFAEDISRRLQANGVDVETFFYDFNNRGLRETERRRLDDRFIPDIAFTIGGDGTTLFAARELAPRNVPVLPFHMGTTGFMSAVDNGDWWTAFENWRMGRVAVSLRMMLQVRIERNGGTVFEICNLNDAVISSEGIARIIRLNAWGNIDSGGNLPYINLGCFRSDGLIASTATGSTAYSAAAGGPILDPEMEAIILNPIAPSTLANRPIVLPSNERVTVEVEKEQRSGVILTIDGQLTEKLLPLDRIVIQKARFKTALIGSGREVFYRALRGKLGWSGGDDTPCQQAGADYAS
jgi:NAD+ kinase